ncbi:Uncharacterised protein [Legionella beliardensis]|uniref:Uncharacterized protein n=1 Tax=Legionella beliardensis TaxID=91822 RepID=A0A378JXP1_9GAMM|nr:hypothetical protein [Legionella beliardensis]STX55510.1 Uncharacterised protein [Legionella beliardensis]
MTAIIRLTLVNQEAAQLFGRTLKNGHLFFERVQLKIGVLIKESFNHNAHALISLYTLYDELLHLHAHFDDEIDKFEALIEKRKKLGAKTIEFKAQFTHEMAASHGFFMVLADLIELFDKLMTTLKLLHLLGLFDSCHTLYTQKERYQRELNFFLSKLIQTPSYKDYSITVEEAIQLKTSVPNLDYSLLKAALDSPFAPNLSPQRLAKLSSALNRHLNQNSRTAPEYVRRKLI